MVAAPTTGGASNSHAIIASQSLDRNQAYDTPEQADSNLRNSIEHEEPFQVVASISSDS